MDEQSVKRTRRTPQQMAEAVDAKIQKLNQELDSLADKRAAANEEFDKKEAAVKEKLRPWSRRKRTFLHPNRRASPARPRSRKSRS